ncbi:MAG: PEP-CTERM sorting domain-containing protein [Desulfobacterales bacterium]|nr:PEP-CTERM sorting domain-containing protein [Desulfobacterales bacterium]
MKKILLLLLVPFIVLGTSQAFAYEFGVDVGDNVDWGDRFTRQGGEFSFSVVGGPNDGYSWQTFCAEWIEWVDDATVTGIADNNTSGYGTGLTDTTAWLYWSFTEDTLAGYTGSSDNQEDLQKLIWSTMGQVSTYSNYSFDVFNDDDLVAEWLEDAADAYTAGWRNDGRVQVLQLGEAQDVLIAALDSNPVPEPTTIALLGIGLIGLAGMGRRKKQE